MTLYDMLEVRAKRSRATLRKLMPSAVLFLSILVIWGTFTANKAIQQYGEFRSKKTQDKIKTKRRKPAMSYRNILTKASGYVACEGAEISGLQRQGSVRR